MQRAARAEGFIDPIKLMSQLEQFAQPSEIDIPLELLRSGSVLQARGLINSRALQHNRDWVLPYWIERQFDPLSDSFIPRAFSLTVINLTHRNWTAVGIPGFHPTPIVDPRGLVMPMFGGWSLDCWVIPDAGPPLYPSQAEQTDQSMTVEGNLAVVTTTTSGGTSLKSVADMVLTDDERPVLRVTHTALSEGPGKLAIALRPLNPEGVGFIHTVERRKNGPGWLVNEEDHVLLSATPDQYCYSRYHEGDVALFLDRTTCGRDRISCEVGMATAAAVYRLDGQGASQVALEVPLPREETKRKKTSPDVTVSTARTPDERWDEALQGHCRLSFPDERLNRLYEETLRTIVLLSPEEVFAGPYTYKRFWFRDAAFIAHALICAGLTGRARNIIEYMLSRQKHSGYFESQDGEWDSNGQVLWTMHRYLRMTGTTDVSDWLPSIRKAADWIIKKRAGHAKSAVYPGLMPAGYSAEHLGPSDYYYWDNFWSIAGLDAASDICRQAGEEQSARTYADEARSLSDAVNATLERTAERLGRPAMPPAPGRRLDSGSVGSLAAGYPLELWEPDDPRLLDTADYLMDNCLVLNGLFHDIFHSGINPYLTLHIAQVLLRAGDHRFVDLMQGIADLASPTGQWPEAVYPRTHGGCMGDGQHAWAAAEWTLMMRNCCIREEPQHDRLVLCSGLSLAWCTSREGVSFGPAPTVYGPVTLRVGSEGDAITVAWQGDWHGQEPEIEIRLPGFEPVTPGAGETSVTISQGVSQQS